MGLWGVWVRTPPAAAEAVGGGWGAALLCWPSQHPYLVWQAGKLNNGQEGASQEAWTAVMWGARCAGVGKQGRLQTKVAMTGVVRLARLTPLGRW